MSGGTLTRGYVVADLADFERQDFSYSARRLLEPAHVHKLREVQLTELVMISVMGHCPFCPLKRRYDEPNLTLGGIEAGREAFRETANVPPPPDVPGGRSDEEGRVADATSVSGHAETYLVASTYVVILA